MFFLKRCGTVGAFFRCEELCSDYVRLSLLAFFNLFIYLQFLVELPDRDTTKLIMFPNQGKSCRKLSTGYWIVTEQI